MNPLTFNLPKDLWFEFEALCKANKSEATPEPEIQSPGREG